MNNVIKLVAKSDAPNTKAAQSLKLSSNEQNAALITSNEEKKDTPKKSKGNRPAGYASWTQMKQRCDNPNHRDYGQYGGRGVTYSSEWKHFSKFAADMGARPTSKHSLDRINPDGNYELANCRWATKTEQTRNRRSTKRVAYQGNQVPVAELAERHNIAPATLSARLRAGSDIESALHTPVAHGGDRRNLHGRRGSEFDVWPSRVSPASQASLERDYALRCDREQSRPEYFLMVTQRMFDQCAESLAGVPEDECDPEFLENANKLEVARSEARALRDKLKLYRRFNLD